jgi:uncharacterized YccA/Bax inhibitor family protein
LATQAVILVMALVLFALAIAVATGLMEMPRWLMVVFGLLAVVNLVEFGRGLWSRRHVEPDPR